MTLDTLEVAEFAKHCFKNSNPITNNFLDRCVIELDLNDNQRSKLFSSIERYRIKFCANVFVNRSQLNFLNKFGE